MSIEGLTSPLQSRRDIIIDYLLTHSNPFQRTQISMMRALEISQATLVKYLAEAKGEGLIIEKPFGTAVIYDIPYDVAIARGLAEKHKIFDLDNYSVTKGQEDNQHWIGKVFNFGEVVYIYARHDSGFTIGIPVYDKDLKELIKAFALGLNLEALFSNLGWYFEQE